MLLKPKIALSILPVILLQIIVLVIPSFLLYQEYFAEQIKEHISDSISQVENPLQLQLNAMQANSLLFSQSSILSRYLRTEDESIRFNLMHKVLVNEFSSFIDAYPEYLEISLLMLDGYEEVSLLKNSGRSLSDQEQNNLYFKSIAKSPHNFTIIPQINPDTKQWVLVLARKVFQKNIIEQSTTTKEELKAYLIIKTNFDFIDSIITSNSLIKHGFMVLQDTKGSPILVNGDKKLTGSSLSEIFTTMPRNHELKLTDWRLQKKNYIVGQKELFNGLFFSIGWSKSELNHLLKEMGYTSLISSFLVMLVSAVTLFWLLNKLLIHPILKLSLSARKMGVKGGRWSFYSKSNDELSDLANTVKEMGVGLLRQKQKVHEIAYIDSLTKLPNRRQFTDELNHHYCRTNNQLPDIALLFIDLDGFKEVNDNFGHVTGDHLLIAVAKRLKNVLRAEDYIKPGQHNIARLGGDEFTVLLTSTNGRHAAEQVAKRILKVFSLPFMIAEREFLMGASIGIAIAAETGESAIDLLKNADTAMYEAKVMGKNTYRFFSKTAALKSLKAMEIKEDLRRAINNNELQLNYQPQICSKSGKMVGCEALVRWYKPGKGWIPPDVFIPIAEESGLIISLGRWVMLEACHQVKLWQAMGYPVVPVWVNVSCVQLEREDMHSVIIDCLMETGLSAELLAMEITETSIMQGKDSILQLKKIQSSGIQIALDDFGTGYSSLSALRGLPINKLKIDKSFITDLNSGDDGKAIVSAIIAMAHQLHLQVVAEGVETAEELNFLKQCSADIIQGYYFSKPLQPNELSEIFAKSVNIKAVS
ncbi:bifunctional diguanylate cyclase/phosphodiesterase [Psychromonas ossibalaenae]|uniref:bifunctional diguanylate cyclase/phosphodiesterase n=1 Tax=Psychromonas ossibalaenae TaxID=444922 RepID=UPI000370B3D5|nr:EAL domain-containing protein [Psychromonas ossibalaenae]